MEDDYKYISMEELQKEKGLQFICYNIRSLFHKIDTFRFDFIVKSMDIIGLCETWLCPSIPDTLINVDNYQLIRNDRGRGRGGGTCFYVNKRLNYHVHNSTTRCTNVEIQSIILDGTGDTIRHKPIVVILIYRPPSSNNALALEEIKNFIDEFDNLHKKELVVMGDLNWDYYGNLGDNIKELEDEYGIEQLIKEPTRVTDKGHSVIDVVLTNMKNIYRSGCLDFMASDHNPVFVIKKRVAEVKEFEYIYKRSLKTYDAEVYQQKLMELDWSVMDLLNDVDEMWNMLKNAMLYEADIMCPYKWVKVNISKPIWFNSTLVELARDRDILFRNYKRGGYKNKETYRKASRKRREFNRLIKTAKDDFYKEQLELNIKNQKRFWQTVNGILGSSPGQTVREVFRHGTDFLCTEEESVEVINNFFAGIGEMVIQNQNYVEYKQLDDKLDDGLLEFKCMNVNDFLEIVKELKSNKSSGVKDLNTVFILDAMKVIPNIYVKICNKSLKDGKFPEVCKTARISIIPKKGDTRVLDNLRPISILPVLGKVLEKFVKKQLVYYLESRGVFNNLQFGFRSHRSIHDAIFYVVDKIQRERNAGRYCSSAFLDLSKAFNCVNHDILIEKLSNYGINGNCLKWFRSYLKDRKQYTQNGKFASQEAAVPSGVPQGSVLGPILYLVYVNDVGCNACGSEIIMFADDTVLLYSGTDAAKVSDMITKDLCILTDYFTSLKLSLNTKKTRIMNFDVKIRNSKTANDIPPFKEVFVKGEKIEAVEQFKYLGILLDNKLKFIVQLKATLSSVNQKVYLLQKIRRSINTNTAVLLFKTMVLPYLEFSNSFLIGCNQREKNKMQRLQNKGLKVALGRERRYNTVDLHREANLLNWEYRARISVCRLIYKHKYNEELLASGNDTRLHEGPVFSMDRPRSEYYKRSVSYESRRLWNTLPGDIRNIDDYNVFKLRIKGYYRNKYREEMEGTQVVNGLLPMT